MTDGYLISKGYKKYKPTPFDQENFVVARFQKRFDDEIGKKYFINVVKYSWDFIDESKRDTYIYEYEGQVSFGENKKSLNLRFSDAWAIEEVEEYMEKLFKVMDANYYEKWKVAQHKTKKCFS